MKLSLSWVNIDKFLPAGSPILDFLAILMEKMKCWQVPTEGHEV